MSDRTTNNNARAIAVDPDGNIHVVWYGTVSAQFQVWYTWRDAATGDWSADTVLTHEPTGACFPCLACDDDGNVHILWQVGPATGGTALCYLRRSSSGLWDTTETVVFGIHVERPSVACRDPGFVVAAWEQAAPVPAYRNVFVSARDAQGWRAPERTSIPSTGQQQFSASVGVDDSSTIGVLWVTSGPGNGILFRRRRGGSWSRIDTLYWGYPSYRTCLHMEPNGRSHAAWNGQAPGGSSIRTFYRQCRDTVWGDSTLLPRVSNAEPGGVSIAADEFRQIHAVWCAESGSIGVEVYYSASDGTGSNWSTPLRLTNAAVNRENPSLC
ncbi:MAG: hypothetical protein JSU73_10900, partial [candidate division WOR-3 bacterium]